MENMAGNSKIELKKISDVEWEIPKYLINIRYKYLSFLNNL